MKRVLLVACVVATVSAVALTSALAGASFTDPAGDASGNAPDITGVQVSNDAGGQILFDVAVSNFTPESAVMLAIDADKNASTGDDGDEYIYSWTVSANAADGGWYVERWDGSKWVEAPHATMRSALTPTGLQWSVNKSELGGTSSFAFKVFAARFTADAVTGADMAPDGIGTWTYDLTAPPPAPTPAPAPAPAPKPAVVKPVFGRVLTGIPVAGRKVVFQIEVKRSDTGAPLKTGKMVCDPSVAGKVLRHAESFSGGVAKLSFLIPKSAKGKTLKVKVTIVNGSQSATKVVSLPIL